MTVLGKILVFVNLVVSLVLCGLIIIVYVTRTNWADAANKFQSQYTIAQKSLQIQTEEFQKEKDQLIREKNDALNDIKKVQAKLDQEEQDHKNTKDKLAKEQIITSKEGTSITSIGTELKRREQEVQTLQEVVNQKDQKIKDLVKLVNDMRDEKVAAEVQVNTFKGRMERMVTQLEDQTREIMRLRKTGLGEASKENPPPNSVEGLVKQTDPSGMILISLGSDAGLARGHTLDVYRLSPKEQYLGQIRLTEVRPTEAVGRPLARLKSPIQTGDRVGNINAKGS